MGIKTELDKTNGILLRGVLSPVNLHVLANLIEGQKTIGEIQANSELCYQAVRACLRRLECRGLIYSIQMSGVDPKKITQVYTFWRLEKAYIKDLEQIIASVDQFINTVRS